MLIFTLATGSTIEAKNGPSRAHASAVRSTMPTRILTVSPPPSFEPNFDGWTPCSDAESLTLSEWANCSTAYNVDRMRSNLTVGLWVLVVLATATFVLTAIRRR